ncbi:hypothetical protein H7F36_11635 [Variovorax sp. PAMC28562]|uniref:glycine-rich domain-containing protein n=1 Tax=Variovorax sp. PAMC28562 TaxID=2762323 RepID=UPI00164D9A50|nr:hypothetical protein [Variovorax sp. PAMC28562]QNK71922.1 hypothetical protein H7F36_11635 [Variovorax sp. PAMC28562]
MRAERPGRVASTLVPKAVVDLLHPNFRHRITGLMWARRGLWVIAVLSLFVLNRQFGTLIAVVMLCLLLAQALKARETSLRRQFVREAELPRFLVGKLIQAYPSMGQRDAELVLRGLRQFFMAHLRSDRKFVAMPSKLVDAAWHEFILHTQGYQRWCEAAFGGMLHHSPAEVLGRDARRNDGLRRSWYWACKEESIDPRKPSRLPLLFALDAKYGVAGGFTYVPDCKATARHDGSTTQCGSDFSSSDSGSGDAGGFGGSESTSSGSGDGGSSSDGGSSGDSGSGCGGGCGGGGGD